MGIVVRLLVRLAAVGVLVLATTLLAVAGFAAFWSPRDLPEQAPLIVVLAGDARPDGQLGPRSADRLDTALRLYKEGRTDRLHFTGRGGSPSVAERMARDALEAGVPALVISVETGSQSTLQNALLTIKQIGPLPPGTLLVTDAFHLPRALFSFRWAGSRDMVPVPSDGFGHEPLAEQAWWIGREALAWWFNLGRALAFSALSALGVERDTMMPMLAEARI